MLGSARLASGVKQGEMELRKSLIANGQIVRLALESIVSFTLD